MKTKLTLLFVILLTSLITRAQVWFPVGVGPTSRIGALAVFNAELYAGGNFSNGDGTRDVLKWNGSAWSSVNRTVSNNVYALAEYNTELYAGGHNISFNDPNNLSCLSRWDESNWSEVDYGIGDTMQASGPSRVEDLIVYNSELYAGGMFFWASGVSTNNIAKWDGSAWSAVGSGTVGIVVSFTVFNGELIVGGAFTSAGGLTANYIAKWNGTTWSTLDTGLNGAVYALSVYNGELYAGGNFSSAGGNPANKIAKWDGSAWTNVGNGMDNTVYALEVFNNELYAGGSFVLAGGTSANRIARWNGTTWSPLGAGMNDEVWDIEVYNSDLYASGLFTTADNTVANYIARLDPSGLGISELSSSEKKLTRIVDLMGRETEDQPNVMLIYIYSDGTTEKVFRVE